MVIEIIISELDFYLIERIRELRINSNLSQVALAQKIGVSEGYIGNIENHKQSKKYNIRMLARIAVALELKSYLDLFPEKIYTNDLVRIKIDLIDKKSLKREGKFGLERLIVLSVTPLTEHEISAYDKKFTGK
ncbi:helix-turn-helix domain-containing protein [Flavobacterium aquiphilum]|uniref:helix-turn-helix domain-containing protein n=1 Tax=Flavobacterium aquiphilum TaxID=3003261 RepID=UPI00248080CD|nr:helix-turn-helix transcriptional regulator [Flavobacterium aquiphilum]